MQLNNIYSGKTCFKQHEEQFWENQNINDHQQGKSLKLTFDIIIAEICEDKCLDNFRENDHTRLQTMT